MKLIKDGQEFHDAVRTWANELLLFKSLAGDLIAPWEARLQHDGKVMLGNYVEFPLSALQTIHYALEEGLLVRFEDLIIADTFADLNEQAEYLW